MSTTALPQPSSPFEVIGYDDLCRDFEYKFSTFFRAARAFIRLESAGTNVVFLVGVPSPAERKLRELARSH